jgi:hypothetical protein
LVGTLAGDNVVNVPARRIKGTHQYAATLGPWDSNPVDAVYDLLTHQRYGLGMPASAIDAATYEEARVAVLREGFLCSPVLDTAQPGLRHLEELLVLYDGFLTLRQGRVAFGVRRPGAVAATVRLDDMTAEALPVVARQGVRDTRNRIVLEYVDRANDYNAAVATVGDDVSVDATEVRVDQRTLRAITRQPVAMQVATRMLLTASSQKLALRCGLTPGMALLAPGDLLAVDDDGTLGVRETPFRVVSVAEHPDWGLAIDALEEVLATVVAQGPAFRDATTSCTV